MEQPASGVLFEDADVGFAPDGEAAEAAVHVERARGIGRRHADDLAQAEAEREEARQHLRHAVHGIQPAGYGQVGADGAWHNALIERCAGYIEAEVLPSVRCVEEDAALLRFHDLGDDLAVVVEYPARVAAEQVGDDVSLFEKWEQVARYGRVVVGYAAVADVYHEPDAAFGGGLLCQPHHLDAQNRNGGAYGANFDTLYERPVGADDADCLIEVYVVASGDLGLVVEAGAGDVQHTDDARVGVGDDVLREASEGVAASAAGVHYCGYAGVHSRQVGVHARLVDAVIDVGVQVYEARNDQLVADVDDAAFGVGTYGGGYLRDCPVLNGDVHARVYALRGIYDPTAGEYEISHGASLLDSIGYGVECIMEGNVAAYWDRSLGLSRRLNIHAHITPPISPIRCPSHETNGFVGRMPNMSPPYITATAMATMMDTMLRS